MWNILEPSQRGYIAQVYRAIYFTHNTKPWLNLIAVTIVNWTQRKKPSVKLESKYEAFHWPSNAFDNIVCQIGGHFAQGEMSQWPPARYGYRPNFYRLQDYSL